MSSLLAKMQEARERLGLSGDRVASTGNTDQSENKDGMSTEELATIMRQINSVASANRIQVTPELFQIRAEKRGVLLPLVVNLAAVLVLVIGVAVMAVVFRQQEDSMDRDVDMLNSAEGRLLLALQQETEEQLSRKEAEIRAIQSRLEGLSQERDEFASSIDRQIAEREAQLREQLRQELDAARQNLQSEGLAEEEIAERIDALEAAKAEEVDRALAEYQTEAEAELTALETELAAREQEFRQSLDTVDRERAAIEDRAARREAELRSELEQAQNAVEQELQQVNQDAERVREELAQLSSRREQEQALSDQLVGFYNRLRNRMETGDYPEAQQTISQLRSFLNSDQVMAVDSLAQRRRADLFVADSMEMLVRRAEAGEPAADSAAAQAEVAQANERLDAVETARDELAEELAGLRAQQEAAQTEESDIQQQLNEARSERDRLQRELESAQAARADAVEELEAEREARIAAQAAREAAQIARDNAQGDRAGLLSELDRQRDRIAELENRVESARSEQESAQATIAELRERIQEMETQAIDARQQIRQLESRTAIAGGGDAAPDTPASLPDAQAQQQAERYREMAAAYQEYRSTQEEALQRGGDSGILQGKAALDSFLASSVVEEAFPGFLDQIKMYDRAFEESGQETIVSEMADEVYQIYSYPGAEARLEYIQRRQQEEENAQMRDFYANMQLIVAGE